MGALDPTYVIFDGDNDMWAYRYMRGWQANDRVSFDFRDAHDIGSLTSRAQDEAYVKSQLRLRMKEAKQAIVLVGEGTKYLRKFVPWEIDLAIENDVPIIVVNLNEQRVMDEDRCPVALRTHCAIHIAFKMKVIAYALDGWSAAYRSFTTEQRNGGWRYYNDDVYGSLGLL